MLHFRSNKHQTAVCPSQTSYLHHWIDALRWLPNNTNQSLLVTQWQRCFHLQKHWNSNFNFNEELLPPSGGKSQPQYVHLWGKQVGFIFLFKIQFTAIIFFIYIYPVTLSVYCNLILFCLVIQEKWLLSVGFKAMVVFNVINPLIFVFNQSFNLENFRK